MEVAFQLYSFHSHAPLKYCFRTYSMYKQQTNPILYHDLTSYTKSGFLFRLISRPECDLFCIGVGFTVWTVVMPSFDTLELAAAGAAAEITRPKYSTSCFPITHFSGLNFMALFLRSLYFNAIGARKCSRDA